jgi:hypothetical protein
MMKTDPLQIAMLAALGFGAFWIFRKFKTGTLNPASRENIIYKATGEVGLKIADAFPSAAERRVAEMLKVQPAPAPAPSSGYLVPASVYSTSAPKQPVPYKDFLPLYGMGRWIE